MFLLVIKADHTSSYDTKQNGSTESWMVSLAWCLVIEEEPAEQLWSNPQMEINLPVLSALGQPDTSPEALTIQAGLW